MNRLLTCTALGLVLGLSPALAQDPADDAQSPPALQDPALPSEVAPSDQGEPSDPATPIPGDTTEMSPSQPDPAAPPSAEAPSEPAMPPAAEAPSESATPPSAEAPQSIEPAAPKSAEADSGGAQFLTKQESSDYLASNLIGQSLYNNEDEVIGNISDLVSDEGGKIIGVLVGHGGFLGMGQKDVALRFEDLKISREDDNSLKVVANLSQDVLASAPDFETLSEQQVTVGKSDREDMGDQGGAANSY